MTAPRVIKRFAYRNTDGDDIRIFRGAPVTFEISVDESIDLTGCTSLRLDIRESATDTNSPLATSEEVNPTGTSFQFTFSSGETNHAVSSGWLVLSAYYPEGVGSSDDNLDPLLVSSLTFVDHNSSRLAPAPPNAAVAMTQTEADSRYLFNTGDSQILIGRYASGTGVLQSITLGANIYLSNSGVLSAGVAGSVPWGNIIGTVTDQSDLVTFVNTKQPSGASLTSIGSFSSVGSIPYYSAANTFSPITIGSGLSFTSGVLSSTVTGSSGGSISDGDKGDITVSGGGSVWTVDSSAITYDKIQNVSSGYILGRTGVSAGVVQEILTSSFGRSLWTGTDAAATRNLLNVDVAGTDNSTNVTLAGTPDYITIAGQIITRNPIDLSSDVSGVLNATSIADGSISNTEFQYLNGVSGNIQSQFSSKVNTGDLGSAAYVDSSEFVSATNTVGANVFFAGADGEAGIAPSFRLIATGDLPTSAVTPGSYTNTNLTVDSKGRIIAASNGTAGSGGGSSVWGSISGTLSNQTDLYSALTGKQPLDSDLTAIAALSTTTFGRGFLEYADAAAAKTGLILNNVENTAISTWGGSSNIHYIGTIYPNTTFESGVSLGISDTVAGLLTFYDATSVNGLNLSIGSLTASRNIEFPDEDGVVATREWASGQFLESTISDALDGITATRGSVIYRGASGWEHLIPGVSGQMLQTNGPGVDPAWETPAGGGGGISDGDKGDIVVSGAGSVFTIDSGVVSYSKIQNVSANKLLGRTDTSGSVQEISISGAGLDLSGQSLYISPIFMLSSIWG